MARPLLLVTCGLILLSGCGTRPEHQRLSVKAPQDIDSEVVRISASLPDDEAARFRTASSVLRVLVESQATNPQDGRTLVIAKFDGNTPAGLMAEYDELSDEVKLRIGGQVQQEVATTRSSDDPLSGDPALLAELERARLKDAEAEVGRLRDDLNQSIQRGATVVAKLELEFENARREREKATEDVAQRQRQIEVLQKGLAEGTDSFEFAGRTYTREQVEKDLEQRIQDQQVHKQKVERAEALIAALTAKRDRSRASLDELRQSAADFNVRHAQVDGTEPQPPAEQCRQLEVLADDIETTLAKANEIFP